MSRGGKRAGAGRPREVQDPTNRGFALAPSHWAALSEAARVLGISRAGVIRRLLSRDDIAELASK